MSRLRFAIGGYAALILAGCADGPPQGPPGRLVVSYPADAVPTGARIAILWQGTEIQADYGNHTFELPSGTYDVDISGKIVRNVTVPAGGETSMKVGVLRVAGASSRRVSVREGGQEIAGAYGGELLGLPSGTYDIYVDERTDTVMIVEGVVSDI
jgi:hypothetical protein